MKSKKNKDPKYGFFTADPIPTKKEVDAFYEKEFYDSNSKYFNNSSLLIQEQQSDFFNSRWEKIYDFSKSFFKSELLNKKVFDIGFGFAQALIYFKNKGLKVSGLEPSNEGVKYAKEQGIKNAYQCSIENLEEVKDKHDIVLLLNVLEHLRDPKKVLLDIKSNVLNKNGLLVIDVPNDFNDFQIAANNEYDLNEWWFYPPNHINYFSHDSLKSLLKGCGYKIEYCTSSFPLDMFLLFGDKYVGNPELGKECHNKRVNFERLMVKHNKKEKLNAFYESLAELNLGRSISIYATPI
jgi:2-polyprenyl-3-methyl-5-hydroxy-6-metoxy-1,4-benzoquinol methylase